MNFIKRINFEKIFLLLPLFFIFLASCKKDKNPGEDDGKLYDLNFGMSLFRQEMGLITGLSKSISAVNDNGAISAAPTGDVDPSNPDSGVDYIYYYVYRQNPQGGQNTFVKKLTQTRSTTGFGKITDQLTKGTYTITVLASKTALQIEELHKDQQVVVMSLPGVDLFQQTFSLTVEGALNRIIYLKRATALLKIKTDDNIPVDVTSIGLYTGITEPYEDPTSNYLDLATGEPGQFSGDLPGDDYRTAVASTEYGKTLELSVYVYGIPVSNPKIIVILKAYSSANQVLYTATVPDVEMENGRQTNLRGPLFSNVQIDGASIKLPAKEWPVKGTVNF